MTQNVNVGFTRLEGYRKMVVDTLDGVKNILTQRGDNYAPPEVNLAVIANLVNGMRPNREVDSMDVALDMVMVKMGRIATGKYNADNFDDAIGYLVIAKYLGLVRMENEVKSEQQGCGGQCTDCACKEGK